ncbi:MAG: hypothetical protein CEE40_07205 [Chloroflexi bacterium B3_Chlor]|nr:MAG: hypothetical protein CEE40_07205 [Chloroflexi bacterium B3_Chlor]
MLDESVFPLGWHICAGPSRIPELERGESESWYMGFCPEGFDGHIGATQHELLRYRNKAEAGHSFPRHGFLNRDLVTPWAVPRTWSYESPLADHFKVACADVNILGVIYRNCQAVAQYDEYISFLNGYVGPQSMTLGDLERILVAIDERMAFYLEEDTE